MWYQICIFNFLPNLFFTFLLLKLFMLANVNVIPILKIVTTGLEHTRMSSIKNSVNNTSYFLGLHIQIAMHNVKVAWRLDLLGIGLKITEVVRSQQKEYREKEEKRKRSQRKKGKRTDIINFNLVINISYLKTFLKYPISLLFSRNLIHLILYW